MLQNRRPQIRDRKFEQLAANLSRSRTLSHCKMACQNILQKKPQLLLMKWNDFIQKYHLAKQLHTINNRLSTVNTYLRKKKEEISIVDVPYIQSEQASIAKHEEGQISECEAVGKNVGKIDVSKLILKTNSSTKMSNLECSQSVNTQSEKKMIISVHLKEQEDDHRKNEKSDSSYQNFTDEDEVGSSHSSNRNGCDVRNSPVKKLIILKSSAREQQQYVNKVHKVEQSLKKTAHFSVRNSQPKPITSDMIQKNGDNQENINNLNFSLKPTKIEVVLKAQNERMPKAKRQKLKNEQKQLSVQFQKKKQVH